MERTVHSVEDVLADDAFLAWYFREPSQKADDWDQWMIQHPESQLLVKEAIQWMDRRPREISPLPDQTAKALAATRTRIPVSVKKSHRIGWRMTAAAASVLVLVLAGWLILPLMKSSQSKPQSWVTGFGQQSRVRLSDGTSIHLNANSELKAAANWKKGEDRELWLSGEAFFEVAKLENKERLTVHTDAGDVIVTGTAFNVKARNNHSIISLKEGSVRLANSNGQELAMRPGDHVDMGPLDIRRFGATMESLLAWQRQKLEFDDSPLDRFVQDIENYYGKKTIVKGSVPADFRITGILSNESLPELLKAFEMATGWEASLQNDQVIFVVH